MTDTIQHLSYDDFGRIICNDRGGNKAGMSYFTTNKELAKEKQKKQHLRHEERVKNIDPQWKNAEEKRVCMNENKLAIKKKSYT